MSISSVSVSWPGPTPKVSGRRVQVDFGVIKVQNIFSFEEDETSDAFKLFTSVP